MPSLILSGDTISVRLESKHLEVIRWIEKGNKIEERMRVPIIDIDRVVIVGRPNVSIAVLQHLMFNGIPSYFVTTRGRWVGSLSPDNNKNAFRRIRQYQLSEDAGFALQISRKIVNAKIRNSRRVLQRLSGNRQESADALQQRIDSELETLANQSLQAESVAELRGYEGIAAARYFARLGSFFPENIPFNGRNRQPPKDAANALLSWTYTILLGEIDGAVRSRGMDACIGFLHEISHGTPSLSLDLLEPFRAPVCDLLVLNILNHHILKEEDFYYDSETDGFYLKEESHRPFFVSYENSMMRKFSASKGDAHTDFRRIIDDSVLTILRAMEGERNSQFFMMP
jgi:CRISPR-associated protein Cas1